VNVPSELYYTKSHEWIRVEGDIATIGITDFAQSELGDVVYVDLPNVGRVVNSGDTIGSVESVKTVSDIYSPLSGTVTETNDALGSQSELVNSDPYGGGWMFKLKFENGLDDLMDAAAYQASFN
jgi:glycine cleavage system H protein